MILVRGVQDSTRVGAARNQPRRQTDFIKNLRGNKICPTEGAAAAKESLASNRKSGNKDRKRRAAAITPRRRWKHYQLTTGCGVTVYEAAVTQRAKKNLPMVVSRAVNGNNVPIHNKKKKTDQGDNRGTVLDNNAVPISLHCLPTDCALTFLTFLRLDERARLAATCRILRNNEREVKGAKHSRDERTKVLVERAKKKEQMDEAAFNKAFGAALEEFDGAGALGAAGLLGLLPLAAPLCNHIPLATVSRRKKWKESFRRAAACWLPFLDAAKLAEQAAGRLIEAGPLPSDVRMKRSYGIRIFENFTSEARTACEGECAEIFKLSLLGRAAVPHLSTLLVKILQPLNREEQLGDDEEELCYYRLTRSIDYFLPPSISRLALETLLILKANLVPSDVDFIANFLFPHFLKKDRNQLSVAASTLVLSKLWDLIKNHNIAQKALSLIPLSEEQATTNSWRARILVSAQCELIRVSRSMKHLGFLLAAARHPFLAIKDPAEDALRSIEPLLTEPEEKLLASEAIVHAAADIE